MNTILTLRMFLIVCPLCFLGGFIDSIAGGGGLITIPAYIATGLPVHMAVATNKLSAAVGTGAACTKFLKGNKVNVAYSLASAACAFPGSYLGTLLLNQLDDRFIYTMMLIIIPFVAGVVLLRRGGLEPIFDTPKSLHIPLCGLSGLVIGLYDGLVGPGTGTFLILLFTLVVGMEAVTASGSAKIVNLSSNLASLVAQLFAGNVVFLIGLPAAVFGLLGNLLGARMAIRGGERTVRIVLAVVLALLLANMAGKLFV